MTDCVLHLGSNVGFKEINLQFALIMIGNRIGEISLQSSIYQTSAWGVIEQEDFLNQACLVSTDLSPQEVLEQIQLIETKMGRVREKKWGPRIIDIDIILFGEELIDTQHLIIPHPEFTNRNFVLIPLAEIIPQHEDPRSNKTISELKECCEDESSVNIFITN